MPTASSEASALRAAEVCGASTRGRAGGAGRRGETKAWEVARVSGSLRDGNTDDMDA